MGLNGFGEASDKFHYQQESGAINLACHVSGGHCTVK
jgi:hypothetical protein